MSVKPTVLGIRLMIAFLLAAPCFWGVTGDGTEQDIVLVIPPELDPPPTEEAIARQKKYSEQMHQASAGLPYLSFNDTVEGKRFFTLGRAAEQCTNIAVVAAVSCESLPLTEKLRVLRISFATESNLWGALPPAGTIDVPWATSWITPEQATNFHRHGINVVYKPPQPPPKEGDRLLVFLSPKKQSKFRDFWNWNTPTNVIAAAPALPLFSFGDAYNVISLDDKKSSREFLTAVSGYIRHLRNKGRGGKSYYTFLKKQTHSPLARIREDARQDMVRFLEASGYDLNKAANDRDLDDGIRTYVRFLFETRKKEAAESAEKGKSATTP